MKRTLALIAVVGGILACADTPTVPESATLASRTQHFTQTGNDHGRLRLFWPAADGMCTMWDAQGEIVVMNCVNSYPPSAAGTFGFTIWADGKTLNTTGRAAVYGPTNYPAFLPEMYAMYFGVGPRNGEMPLCDWNLRDYPDAYQTWDLTTLKCTTNWSYTISASGKARMHALFDPAHTYSPYP